MDELPKQYRHELIEQSWVDFWKKKGYFHADPHTNRPPFCIVLPPPNVTGILHMGHAFVDTLQDLIARWRRMHGDEVLWLPGLDHAGISTQAVVERHLLATTGKKRIDFTREAFTKEVWNWKEKRGSEILEQLSLLGCSCDWRRQRFTMDPQASLAVRTLFKKLFTDSLIYRGNYLVNWDPIAQTALADDEVEYEEKDGYLWYFRYPLKEDQNSSIVIATTRPETMLGDVAIAVSPSDPRYRPFIGKEAILPIVNRPLPIIADHRVDPKFGTGAVKITPAHDPNDYEIGKDHHLAMINILRPDGTLNENGLEYEGMEIQEARGHITSRMKEMGLLEKKVPHRHRVGTSYRSHGIIQPFLSKQWFIRMEPFKQKLIDAVKNGKVKLTPKSFEKTYFHWIENLRDWCISRQLWWGHQIPIWYNRENQEEMLCHDGLHPPKEVVQNPEKWKRDEDVLDTWFSSALWPFSTLGWPHKTPELAKFYPNSLLITGHDILFFWVARMMMMGEYAMGELPFKQVALQGLIYGKSYFRKQKDGHLVYCSFREKEQYDLENKIPADVQTKWEKMSKSKGNVIDPLEMIGIYGADAVRLSLVATATQNRQIDLDRRRFEEFRNFANKMWNGARFVLMNTSLSGKDLMEGIEWGSLSLEDQWILNRLRKVIEEVDAHLTNYVFDKVATTFYAFFWDEFCAYYLEIAKAAVIEKNTVKQKILINVLVHAILLIHPVAPFVTEEIFAKLRNHFSPLAPKQTADPYTTFTLRALSHPSCSLAPYPSTTSLPHYDPKIEERFHFVREVIKGIRQIRAEMGFSRHEKSALFLIGPEEKTTFLLKSSSLLQSLTSIENIQVTTSPPSENVCASTSVDEVSIFLPLSRDLLAKEKARRKKEIDKITQTIDHLEVRLNNPHFISHAPKEVVEKEKRRLLEMEKKRAILSEKISHLEKNV